MYTLPAPSIATLVGEYEFRVERGNVVHYRIEIVPVTGKGKRIARNQDRQSAYARARNERFAQ